MIPTKELVCRGCGAAILGMRVTKRFCDECIQSRMRGRLRALGEQGWKRPAGVCPDCGAPSSYRGRRCDPCGRRVAGANKHANSERRRDAERRTAIALLRDWGSRHGRVGPTMAAWDEAGYMLTALRVLGLFDGWLNFLDVLSLEYPSRARAGKTPRRKTTNRTMVTGGLKGAKSPYGDLRNLDRTAPPTHVPAPIPGGK